MKTMHETISSTINSHLIEKCKFSFDYYDIHQKHYIYLLSRVTQLNKNENMKVC